MNSMSRLCRNIAGAIAGTLLATSPALACGFHGYVPQETLVERLLGSERIVLARAAETNPFRYEATQFLRGPDAPAAIPQLVDSSTRRRLSLNPTDSVLFALDYDGNWNRLAYVDAPYLGLMDEILARMQIWEFGSDDDRYQFFANRLNDRNPAIALLALKELDAAPYDVFDRLDLDPDVPALLNRFFAPERAQTIPIRLLLLGKSGDERARTFLRARYADGRRPTGPMAGAFALALIEIDGADAARRIARLIAHDRNLDDVTRNTMLDALAIQSATGGDAVRDTILQSTAALIAQDSAFAAPVARQFAGRGVWDLAGPLKAVVDAGRLGSPSERYEVESYLDLALND